MGAKPRRVPLVPPAVLALPKGRVMNQAVELFARAG